MWVWRNFTCYTHIESHIIIITFYVIIILILRPLLNALEGLIPKSCVRGEHACVSSGWCARITQGWRRTAVVVPNKGILKKVNLRQLHLDTLLSFPKAISRRTKLGTAAAWSGAARGERIQARHNPCYVCAARCTAAHSSASNTRFCDH